jgi:hypothetical protein
MFESIRKHWAQARADVVSKQVEDILQRYERMNPNDKYWVFSAFEHMLSEVEDQHGALAEWNAERKSQIAKQIMHSAQKAFSARGDNMSAETTRLGANGGALLSCYLELQTVPGNQADKVVVTIEGWREHAQKSSPYADPGPIDQLHRVRQAIATISEKALYGKEATEHSASAAALLTAALVRETIVAITDDDDRFTAGIFAFVFADYFSRLLAGQFETAASLAVMMVLGQGEFDRCFTMIQESFNRMVGSSAGSMKAIGTTCDAWFKNPTAQQFGRLAELFKLSRGYVVQK